MTDGFPWAWKSLIEALFAILDQKVKFFFEQNELSFFFIQQATSESRSGFVLN